MDKEPYTQAELYYYDSYKGIWDCSVVVGTLLASLLYFAQFIPGLPNFVPFLDLTIVILLGIFAVLHVISAQISLMSKRK